MPVALAPCFIRSEIPAVVVASVPAVSDVMLLYAPEIAAFGTVPVRLGAFNDVTGIEMFAEPSNAVAVPATAPDSVIVRAVERVAVVVAVVAVVVGVDEAEEVHGDVYSSSVE